MLVANTDIKKDDIALGWLDTEEQRCAPFPVHMEREAHNAIEALASTACFPHIYMSRDARVNKLTIKKD